MSTINRVDINQVLMQMRQLKAQAQVGQANPVNDINTMKPNGLDGAKPVERNSFGNMLTSAIDQVNNTQKASSSMQQAYELGDPQVSLSEVMVASQKASVAFQSMTQVRNKLVRAYEDIMKMPI